MNDLMRIMAHEILEEGPLPLSRFMELALGHPKYGYYMKQDPFGRAGDFVTAPEISQMFGEMVGLWFAECWRMMGAPKLTHLVEVGPGRGTLMSDILRAARMMPGLSESLDIHLVEMSPHLRRHQKETLKAHRVTWHDSLDTLPDEGALFVIGNEFFDALPIEQLVKSSHGWLKRHVGLSDDGAHLKFMDSSALSSDLTYLPETIQMGADLNDVYEISPVTLNIASNFARRIKAQSGLALWIDYGHDRILPGDSLQAVKNHHYHPILEDVGDADLTAHVAFQNIRHLVAAQGLRVHPVVTQGDFLLACGIETRAVQLKEQATEKQRLDIEAALQRLTAHDAMGHLFKCMAFSSDPELTLPCFPQS